MKSLPKYKIESRLIPNDYIRGLKNIFGIILDVRTGILDDYEYDIILTNGNRFWKNQSVIGSLFIVPQEDP